MQYALFMIHPEASELGLTEEDMAPAMRAFDLYAQALDEAGVLVSADVLQPSATSTTVSRKDGELNRREPENRAADHRDEHADPALGQHPHSAARAGLLSMSLEWR